MGTRVRRAMRVARTILIGLVLLVTVPLVLVHAALLLPPVRDFVRDKASAAASDALKAKVQIARLDGLSIFHLRARGIRVLSPAGQPLASLERIALDLNPLTLIGQRLTIRNLELDRPFVDLGAPADEGGGLPGLFASDEPKPEEPKSEPSNFQIDLDRLRIDQGAVAIKAQGAQYRVEKFATQLAGRFGPVLGVRVKNLGARVTRDAREVATVAGNDLGYGGTGEGRARLVIRSGNSAVSVSGTLGAADADDVQDVRGRLRVDQISAETLANFGIDAKTLLAPVDLELRVDGTTQDLHYQATIATAGGDVQIEGRAQPPAATATIRTDRLDPREFLDADIDVLSALIELRANRDPSTEKLALEVDLKRGSYGGGDLPRLELRARRNAAGDLWLDRLEARYPKAELSAKGHRTARGSLAVQAQIRASSLADLPPSRQLDLGLAGALQGEVTLEQAAGGKFKAHADLQLTRTKLGTLQADALTLRADAHGDDIARPALVLEVHGGDLVLPRTRLARADLTVAGGPERYFIAGNFADRGSLQAEVTRNGEAVGARGRLSVAIDERGVRRPLRAEIGALDYAPDGALSVRNVRVRYRDAHAEVNGSLDARKQSQLRALVEIPKLAELTGLFMEKPLGGGFRLEADVRGSPAAPRLKASASYRTKALNGLKDLAVDVAVQGDVPARKLELAVRGRSHAGKVELDLNTQLRAARADAAAFTEGKHDLALRIDRFLVSELTQWPRGTAVPTRAEVSGEITAKGRLQDAEVHTDLRSGMRFGGDAGGLSLAARGSYAGEQLALELEAEDRKGPLMRTKVQTELTRRRISRDPDFVKRLLKERSWEVSLWLGGRRIDDLPMLRAMKIPEAVLPAEVSAQFDLAHMPGQEPKGHLKMRAAWDPPGQNNAKEVAVEKPAVPRPCGLSNRPSFDFDVAMRDGELHSELIASLAGKPALVMRTESHAPIDEWFHAEPTRIRPAGVAVRFTDLRLSQLPLACEYVDGHISGHAEMSRALTEKVSASIDVQARQVRWGTAPAFDASISASADRQTLKATTKLNAADGSALIQTDLPLDGRGRMPGLKLDAPAYGRIAIRNMDMRALLGPVPNVRASAGRLDTDLTFTGSVLNPDLNGKIKLREVTVTLAELGQRVERVSGEITLKHRTVTLDRLKIHDRDGKAELTGQLSMPELGTFKGGVNVSADNFPVRKTGVMIARFNGTAKLQADVAPDHTNFDLTLHRARIELTDEDMASVQTLRTNPDIVFSDTGAHEIKAIEETSAVKPLVFNIDASEPFWVTRSDFSVLVATKLKVEAGEGPVSVTGTVDLDRGYIELIGQSFDIEQGHIEFTGGREVEPTLDLTANHKVPGGKKITIKATGTLREPQLAFFVDEEAVTAGEALSAATGSRGSGSDTTVQQQVSSMATGLAAGVLTLGARRELGEWMPVLSIDAGENGPSVRAGIEADRFIPSFLRGVVVDAYVEGIISSQSDDPDGRNPNSSSTAMPAALLELRFPHDLVGEAQYGPGERWSVDIGWEP